MRPNEIKCVSNNAKCVSNGVKYVSNDDKCVAKYVKSSKRRPGALRKILKALMNGVKSAGGVQMRSKQSQNTFQAEQKLCAVSDLPRSNVFE